MKKTQTYSDVYEAMKNKKITFDNSPKTGFEMELTWAELYSFLITKTRNCRLGVFLHVKGWTYLELSYDSSFSKEEKQVCRVSDISEKDLGYEFVALFASLENVTVHSDVVSTEVEEKIYQADYEYFEKTGKAE